MLVGVPASIGVLMAAADRLLFYVVLAVVALAMVRGGTGDIQRLTDDEVTEDMS